jgi:hypothetical protein
MVVMAEIKPKHLATFVKAASAPPFVKTKAKLPPIDVGEKVYVGNNEHHDAAQTRGKGPWQR